MKKEYIKIVPDKSLFPKIGVKNYRPEEAIAELVDNSVDAAIESEPLKINLKISKNSIEIFDNGMGMTKNQAIKAITLAYSNKINQLGMFGLGMKAACMNLGTRFEIITKSSDVDEEYYIDFDQEKWEKDKTMGWENFPIFTKQGKKNSHYTIIRITNLRKEMSDIPRIVNRIKKDFGIRYGPLISDKKISINVNDKSVNFSSIDIDAESKLDFDFNIDNNPTKRVIGWIGIQIDPLTKKPIARQKGSYYGFMTYRNGRMITKWDKMVIDDDTYAILPHTTSSYFVGEVNLDFLPVENDKRSFIQDNNDYIKVVKKIYDYFLEIKKRLNKRLEENPVTHDVAQATKIAVDSVNEALKDEEIEDLLEDEGVKNPLKIKGVLKSPSKQIRDMDIELREEPEESQIGTVEPVGTNRKRTPKKIQRKKKPTEIEIEGKSYKVDHKYVKSLPNERFRDFNFQKDGIFLVITSCKFITKITGAELPVFALHNICISLAEYIFKGKEHEKIEELKEKLLKVCSEKMRDKLINQVIEENL